MIILLIALFVLYYFFFGPALETAGYIKGLSDDDEDKGCGCLGCLAALGVFILIFYLLFD